MFIEKNRGEQKQSPELFYKKGVLKNFLQNSKENTYAEVSFTLLVEPW